MLRCRCYNQRDDLKINANFGTSQCYIWCVDLDTRLWDPPESCFSRFRSTECIFSDWNSPMGIWSLSSIQIIVMNESHEGKLGFLVVVQDWWACFNCRWDCHTLYCRSSPCLSKTMEIEFQVCYISAKYRNLHWHVLLIGLCIGSSFISILSSIVSMTSAKNLVVS